MNIEPSSNPLSASATLWFLAVLVCGWGGASAAAASDDFVVVSAGEAARIDTTAYVDAVRASGRAPAGYLVDKCKEHDLVLLGEEHGIRENCEFVASVLEPLYRQAGVRRFATEFVRSRNTERVNRLVTGAAYDRDLGVAIMRDYAWPTWGYQEYMDIFEAVWRLNAALPAGADPLLIVPLDSDWSQHDLFFKDADPRVRFKMMEQREKHMIGILMNEVLAPGRKAVAHMGYLHSVTGQGRRLGATLRKGYGSRVFQVSFHHRFPEPLGASAVCRLIERVMQESGGQPVGFDVPGTPFALLHDPKCMAFTLGGKRAFGSLAEGYVFLKPAGQLHSVHWIDGFIVEANFREALDVAAKMKLADPKRDDSPAKLDARLKQAIESR